jgi:hypothetical protein
VGKVTIGSEFGARHELYEINYAGSTEESRLGTLGIEQATGLAQQMRNLTQTCMDEYARVQDRLTDVEARQAAARNDREQEAKATLPREPAAV